MDFRFSKSFLVSFFDAFSFLGVGGIFGVFNIFIMETITKFSQCDGRTNDTFPTHLEWLEDNCIH